MLIWATSQIVEARDAGIRTSRRMATTPYEILSFIRPRHFASVTTCGSRRRWIACSRPASQLRSGKPPLARLHRFSWINEWKECADGRGRPLGLELILPDWFYAGIVDASLVLTIDAGYFSLTGGIERWLYRLVRKHAGRQTDGWRFDFRHLYRKSGSLARFSDFAGGLAPNRRAAVAAGISAVYLSHRSRHRNARLPRGAVDGTAAASSARSASSDATWG